MVLETTSRPPGRVETGLTVAEVMDDAFVAAGADTQFGLMGDPNMHFMAAARSRARLFDIRHEGAADAMADGYARVSGRVGVATVTSGAGLMYTGNSLMTASRHRTPMVVLAGDVASTDKGMGGPGVQDMDQRAFAHASGALHHAVHAPGMAAAGPIFPQARVLRIDSAVVYGVGDTLYMGTGGRS